MSRTTSLSLALTMAVLTGCAPVEPPVGQLNIIPQSVELTYPQFVSVTLEWTMTEPLGEAVGGPRVFLHLVDATGEVVRTFEHDFPRAWSPGAEVSYSVKLSESALVPALADGQYALTAGLYDGTGRRWSLEVKGEEVRPQEYRIATITAVSSSESPQFFFSPTWLPVEGGTDLQIMARRWLGDDGVLRLSEIPGPGSLHLGIGIPKAGGPQELVLEEGASVPAVRLATTCGDYETEVSGSGSHVVEVPVVADTEEAGCDVSFTANYYLLSRDNMSRRTMALEDLSWSPQ